MAPPPTYIGSSNAINTTSASADNTCTYPSSVPGDFLLFVARFIRLVDAAYTVATPSGWQPILLQNPSGASDSNAIYLFGRFRDTETSVTATASIGTDTYSSATIQAWRNVAAVPVNASASSYSNASSTSNNTPAATTTTDNCAVALFATGYRSGSQTAYTYSWTGPTERQDTSAAQAAANVRVGLTDATDTQAVAGSTGAKTCTSSVATLGRFAATVALAPASQNFFAVF